MWILILLAVAAVVLLPRFKSVPADEVAELVQRGAVVIDVRTEGEFSSGAAPRAINIPLGQERQALPANNISVDKPVLLYCASGARSSRAVGIYKDLGFTVVLNLGGLAAARKTLAQAGVH